MLLSEAAPGDAVAHAIGVYDRSAERYAITWDGSISPEMTDFAAQLPVGAVVLDAGCGPGRDLIALRSLGLCAVGADLSRSMIRVAARSGAPLQVADLAVGRGVRGRVGASFARAPGP